jgi:hypothetical protein
MSNSPANCFEFVTSLTDAELGLACAYAARPRLATDIAGRPLTDSSGDPFQLPAQHEQLLSQYNLTPTTPQQFADYSRLKQRLIDYIGERTSTYSILDVTAPAYYQLLLTTLGGLIDTHPLPLPGMGKTLLSNDFLARQYAELETLITASRTSPFDHALATALAANWPASLNDLLAVVHATQLPYAVPNLAT